MKSKILIGLVGALPFLAFALLAVYGEDWAAQCGVPCDVVCIVQSIVLIGGCGLFVWLCQKYVHEDDENVPHKTLMTVAYVVMTCAYVAMNGMQSIAFIVGCTVVALLASFVLMFLNYKYRGWRLTSCILLSAFFCAILITAAWQQISRLQY